MSEQLANVEFAHKLHEKGSHQNGSSFRLEIVEALLLAIVAVATAWSGYQSAKWDGHSAESYAQAAAYRIDGDEDLTRGGQERLQNISTTLRLLHQALQLALSSQPPRSHSPRDF